MLTSFYTSAAGTITQQQSLDIVANNLSNVSTGGYQPSRASFSDLLYTNLHEPENARRQAGHGEKIGKTDTVFKNGGVQSTGRKLDYALPDGNSFFAAQTSDGDIRYTRNGSFYMSQASDGTYYLADSAGGWVLDGGGNPIPVTDEDAKLPVGIYRFQNRDGLLKTGDNYFQATDVSGAASPDAGGEALQGTLESSAVEMTDGMYDLIQTQKAFAFNAKLVQMSDEITQTVNSLR
jgi:flagellar basal-body rod protein FlgG